MQRLVLADDLLTGIDAVDDQHRELFNWGNALLFPEGLVADDQDFSNGLKYMAAYVGFHFGTEEQAMESFGYDRLEAHQWQHRHFRREIRRLVDQAFQQGPSRALKHELHYLVQDWFTGHIRFADGQFAAWLKAEPRLERVTPANEDALRQMGLDPDLVRVVRPDGLISPREARARSGR